MSTASSPASEPWTFESLARASNETRERALREGSAPDFAELEGRIYRGLNCNWVALFSGRKFKKGFRRRDGEPHGYNEICHQDGRREEGVWKPKLEHGRPVQLGYFRVGSARDAGSGGPYDRYAHLGHLNYNLPLNGGRRFFLRPIRDFVALPNAGDHGLLLCKAYLELGSKRANLYYCYFLLGHPEPIADEPW